MILFVCSRPIWKKAIICHIQLHVHISYYITLCTLTLCFCRTSDTLSHQMCSLWRGSPLYCVCVLDREWSLFLCGSFGCPRGRAAVAASRLSVSLQFHCPALLLFKPSSPLSCSPLHLSLHSQRPPFSAGVEKEAPSIPHNGRTTLLFIYPFLRSFIYSPGYFWSAVDYDLLIMGWNYFFSLLNIERDNFLYTVNMLFL